VPPSPGLLEPSVPPGFSYQEEFISAAEELTLLDAIAGITFSEFIMRGVVARRRVAFFGQSYGHESAPPLPDFLLPLRERIAAWSGLDANAFAMALINEYSPGAPIGWHRDAPQYDVVTGVSLLSSCRMKFRRYAAPAAGASPPVRRSATHEIVLHRRSAYVMREEARNAYEHHIPAVPERRYSVTFRTLRER